MKQTFKMNISDMSLEHELNYFASFAAGIFFIIYAFIYDFSLSP